MKETNTWIRIAYCRDIPVREGRAVKIGGREIAVFNLGDRVLAVENRCPHKGGPLADGIVSGLTVVCPLHAWKMSLETGMGVTGPSASSCVETFRTRVEGEVILLEMNDRRTQPAAAPTKGLAVICGEAGGVAGGVAAMTDYPTAAEA
jgi:nitrite reductase (NADH) small subunit